MFDALLRDLSNSLPGVLAAVFVDHEGECIACATDMGRSDALITAATSVPLTEQIQGLVSRLAGGVLERWSMVSESCVMLVEPVGEGNSLVVVATGVDVAAGVERKLPECAADLRREAGLRAAGPGGDSVLCQVRTRQARGWPYAPVEVDLGGISRPIRDVLGRWTEPAFAGQPAWVCFRVALSEVEERTLIHDPVSGRWGVRTGA